MSDIDRCREPDCLGRVRITTNGMGGTVALCEACEARRRHFADVVARVTRKRTCCVCGVVVVSKAANKVHCKACRKLARKRYRYRHDDKVRNTDKVRRFGRGA